MINTEKHLGEGEKLIFQGFWLAYTGQIRKDRSRTTPLRQELVRL